jgi:Raf kinase inhibitor-like YbhB/YbcL family protein
MMSTILTGIAVLPTPAWALELHSSVFQNGGQIPAIYTCEGRDISPPLGWSGVPAAAKSLALIADDPDAPDPSAPKGTWVHWVLYDLPPADGQLLEATDASRLPFGTHSGTNNFGKQDYGGPCPPVGRHRYFFKLYALDTVLANLGGISSSQLQFAMDGHVLAQAQLIGTYAKTGGK